MNCCPHKSWHRVWGPLRILLPEETCGMTWESLPPQRAKDLFSLFESKLGLKVFNLKVNFNLQLFIWSILGLFFKRFMIMAQNTFLTFPSFVFISTLSPFCKVSNVDLFINQDMMAWCSAPTPSNAKKFTTLQKTVKSPNDIKYQTNLIFKGIFSIILWKERKSLKQKSWSSIQQFPRLRSLASWNLRRWHFRN